MDVFRLRDRVISEYSDYVTSFITIQDRDIAAHVGEKLLQGILWPEPLLQLNPSFTPGPLIDALVEAGVLHPVCGEAFRIRRPGGASSTPLRLHQHQADAIAAAQSGESYVLTTGTGSGKSLAYIIPIVDRVLRSGSGKGIKAIVVYPMNALANSQEIELEKFLWPEHPEGRPPVTFRCYTGQESQQERDEIKAEPPDILLTNYVMLELLLTRPSDKAIISAAQGLEFLVLDELHTYRGRQGADVAMLVRRVRDACHSPGLQCIGTSATLAGGASFAEQQQQIASVASRIFGAAVSPERVIGETLCRLTEELHFTDPDVRAALTARVRAGGGGAEGGFGSFRTDPLSSWIESTFGLSTEGASGRLRRANPRSVAGTGGAAETLSDLTGLSDEDCGQAIAATLMAGYQIHNPDTNLPVFAFRLHQFVSRGDTVYSSLEAPGARHITLNAQQFVPGDRSRVLLPLAFCRECGQEYYVVTRRREQGQWTYFPRDLRDMLRDVREDADTEDEAGFLFSSPENPWPSDPEEMMDRLPEDWVQRTGTGRTIKRDRRKWRPEPVELGPDGRQTTGGHAYHFLRAPFPFCMNCQVTYASRMSSDFGKLAALSSEQRSSATTVLGLSVLQNIRSDETLEQEARKLLSFTDNRQDASLQAGHFNDFVEVGLLRAAIYRSVEEAGDEGITYEDLPTRVFRALDLPLSAYAADPSVRFSAKTDTDRALREVLGYRIYHDLRRGWRVSAPNLEQCGLLRIRYASLEELCAEDAEWAGLHPALSSATPDQRAAVCQALLDFLRRQLALRVNYLDPVHQESLRQLSSQRLVEPWAIDEAEKLAAARTAYPRSRRSGNGEERDDPTGLYISARSGFGMYLRRPGTFPAYDQPIDTIESDETIRQLFRMLAVGIIEQVSGSSREDEAAGYQLPASALVWLAGDGTAPARDPISVPRAPREGARTNQFFLTFYREWALQLKGLEGREHTAQVRYEDRIDRENRFRDATLPVLFCSPTMELGVDIAQLNVVNMRNVPPTPANYAQRSGRAGRSGQPALVYTYCTTGSPHDQYFFRRPDDMVSGAVSTPRLDLANEDLIRAHVDAVWLAEADLELGSSLQEVLDLEGTPPSLELRPSVREKIALPAARERAAARLRGILSTIGEDLSAADWYTPDWLMSALQTVEARFEAACERWRTLYRSALQQFEAQNRIIGDATRPLAEKEQAKRLRAEAEAQLELLTDRGSATRSDFYSYRYFASEGFLPGYSFPRLPLSAYIPARRRAKGAKDEFLSRPRFLAISEFGPRAIVYHEGSHYVINKAIFPVGEDVVTGKAKLCPRCGYLHSLDGNGLGADVCEHCGARLGVALQSLFRLRNVSTRRRDRITSDEEERVRMGYDLMTAVRFVPHGDRPACRTADAISAAGDPLLRLHYGQSADIWRINLGWRRRTDKNRYGFVLDLERGYWEKDETNPDDQDDPMSARKARVIPYVEDWRNCLLVEPPSELPIPVMASLQAALKTATQVLYQLEDDELAAEPMPDRDERHLILLYEAAEGGAGVLRQLVDDPEALRKVAQEALRLCHFDPDTGDDLEHAEGRDERCEAACYDCLMSYYNQLDHRLVDRQCVRELLLALAGSTVRVSPGDASRGQHLQELRERCETGLEREWLDLVMAHSLRLPDAAQHRVEACNTVPDFWYAEHRVAIYVDGPVHDQPDVAAEDQQINDSLLEHGYLALRFHHAAKPDWLAECRRHPEVFGLPRTGAA